MAVVGDRRALAAQDIPARPARVLVVRSDAGSRASTSRALSDAGFEVGEAPAAAAAAASAHEDRFDLVILDAVLPDISGVDALRTLREHADVPVIVVSSKDSDLERVLYLELGADDCLPTPLSLLELVSRVPPQAQGRDQVTEALRTLDLYQHALPVPTPPKGSFDPAGRQARQGRLRRSGEVRGLPHGDARHRARVQRSQAGADLHRLLHRRSRS